MELLIDPLRDAGFLVPDGLVQSVQKSEIDLEFINFATRWVYLLQPLILLILARSNNPSK